MGEIAFYRYGHVADFMVGRDTRPYMSWGRVDRLGRGEGFRLTVRRKPDPALVLRWTPDNILTFEPGQVLHGAPNSIGIRSWGLAIWPTRCATAPFSVSYVRVVDTERKHLPGYWVYPGLALDMATGKAVNPRPEPRYEEVPERRTAWQEKVRQWATVTRAAIVVGGVQEPPTASFTIPAAKAVDILYTSIVRCENTDATWGLLVATARLRYKPLDPATVLELLDTHKVALLVRAGIYREVYNETAGA